jgi:hypothetical protein
MSVSSRRNISSRRNVSRCRVAALQLALALGASVLAACALRPERSILAEFFAASRLRDTTALARISTTIFEPLDQGIVVDFEIVDVKLDGDRRKLVTIEAPVRLRDGSQARQRLVVTLEQGIKSNSPDDVRRWFVTRVARAQD